MTQSSGQAGNPPAKRDFGPYIDVSAAVLLGLATVAGAYAAYQSSLWGGNCQTAYTQGTNKLADANREMLRGVQERAFDTTIWIETMKARDARARAEAAAAAAAAATEDGEADDEEDEAESAPDRAESVLDALAYQEDAPLAKKLEKLQGTRRDLTAALAWADKSYEKRMKTMSADQLRERVKAIMALEDKQQAIWNKQLALIEPLGLDEEADESEIEDALDENAAVAKEYEALDVEWVKLQKQIEEGFDKLGKPMFFESPEYARKQERLFRQLTEEGNKLIREGQDANTKGDRFTLTTVLFTVTLFFAGLSSTLQRAPIKIAFLVMAIAMMVYSVIQLFSTPFA